MPTAEGVSEEPSSPPETDKPAELTANGTRGWSFFDPANLISLMGLTAAAFLCVEAMRERGAPDWYMPIGLYVCLATLVRGTMFACYRGRRVAHAAILLVLVGGLMASAALWEDRSASFQVLKETAPVRLPPAPGFHTAALLHVLVSVTLVLHLFIPRRWLLRSLPRRRKPS